MSTNGPAIVKVIGLAVTGLSAQALIRGLFDQDSEPLWGVLNGLIAGRDGQLIVIGIIGFLGLVLGVTAHFRQKPRRGDSEASRRRATT